MKSAWIACGACTAEWEDRERRPWPHCPSCGSLRVETLLVPGQTRAADFSRVPRDERIAGLALLAGVRAVASAQERIADGEDPRELEAEVWLATERPAAVRQWAKEEIFLTESEEAAAAESFRRGWDWLSEPSITPSTRG